MVNYLSDWCDFKYNKQPMFYFLWNPNKNDELIFSLYTSVRARLRELAVSPELERLRLRREVARA